MPLDQTPPAVPAAPSAPQPPAIPGNVTFSTGELTGRPMTQADVDALKARRNELKGQLDAAVGRRNETARSLSKSEDGVAKTGIEQRLSVLDQRIVQIEQDIATNGRQLALAPGALVASSEQDGSAGSQRYGPFSSGQLTAISIVSIVMIWAPLAFAGARVMLKRWAVAKPAPQLLENADRIARMEESIDAIAIEIERISEGQRFVTQLMAKRSEVAALGEGAAVVEPKLQLQPEPVTFERR
jgi:hypothetical protein